MGTRLLHMIVLLCGMVALGCGTEPEAPQTTPVCPPFEKSCMDGVPQECNALGTGYLVRDACDSDSVCEEGDCIPLVVAADAEGSEGDGANDEPDVSDACSLNSDCVEAFSDNPCVNPICNKGECIGEPLAEGAACEGGICLEAECIEVVCEQGATLCASDVGKTGVGLYICNPLGTGYEKDSDCDDGDSCNGEETCAEGVCGAGEDLVCVDENPCTDDTCSPLTGCVFEPLSGPCDDGNACTNGDGCIGGSCVGGLPLSCEDSDLCTVDSCDQLVGCVNESIPEGGDCNDGNACTEGENCVSGLCSGGNPPDCKGDSEEQCLVYLCDSVDGCVEPLNEANGVGCIDGLLCTAVDGCQSGVCVGLQDMNCDDGDPCTVDACEEGSGCVSSLSEGLPCDDGEPCTGNDQCQEGLCTPGSVLATNDCGMPLNGSCLLFGEAGEQKVCSIYVARKHSAVPSVTGIQFDLSYESDLIRLVGLQDEVCVDGECVDVELPEFGLDSGHAVALNPAAVDAWDGSGKVLVSLFGEPIPLNESYLSVAGTIVGEGQVMNVIVELETSISEAAPTFLYFDDIFAATASANAMKTTMFDGIIVVNFAVE